MNRVGFLGLGIMGSRMARNLAKRGFEVTVWNRTRRKAEELAAQGMRLAQTPAELASHVDALCTCLADPAAMRQVTFGPEGILQGIARGKLAIDFSTLSPDDTRALDEAYRAKGVEFIESPVTGSKLGAEKGTLVLMLGGTESVIARAEPILAAVSEKQIHCGSVGAGSQVKLAGNALLALMLQGLSEGMLLTQRAGGDARKFLEVVQASGYRSPYFDFKGPAILARDFDTHFSIDLMFKDLSLFLASAAQHRVPTPAVSGVVTAYQLARAQGKGAQDIGAVVTSLEDVCGEKLHQ
jgi:3-hydroxyisobutyrate dehydrogenase-like beta-hydroxyacid dehydrogenase